MSDPNSNEASNSVDNKNSSKSTEAVSPFANNWTQLPPASAAGSNNGPANMNNNLNINLPGYYVSGNSSVISGPPLLGRVGMSGNPPTRPGGMHVYSNYASASNDNSSTGPTLESSTTNTSAPESLKRSHSNSFTGFPFTGQSSGTLNQTGGLVANHIDFMNINNSPPLLSGNAQGIYLSNLGNKSGDGMTMFSGMHGILPMSSGGYSNLAGFSTGSIDALTSSVGNKRPLSLASTGTTTSSTAASAKKAKATTPRVRAASYTSPAPVAAATTTDATSATVPPGQAPPPHIHQSSVQYQSASVPNVSTITPLSNYTGSAMSEPANLSTTTTQKPEGSSNMASAPSESILAQSSPAIGSMSTSGLPTSAVNTALPPNATASLLPTIAPISSAAPVSMKQSSLQSAGPSMAGGSASGGVFSQQQQYRPQQHPGTRPQMMPQKLPYPQPQQQQQQSYLAQSASTPHGLPQRPQQQQQTTAQNFSASPNPPPAQQPNVPRQQFYHVPQQQQNSQQGSGNYNNATGPNFNSYSNNATAAADHQDIHSSSGSGSTGTMSYSTQYKPPILQQRALPMQQTSAAVYVPTQPGTGNSTVGSMGPYQQQFQTQTLQSQSPAASQGPYAQNPIQQQQMPMQAQQYQAPMPSNPAGAVPMPLSGPPGVGQVVPQLAAGRAAGASAKPPRVRNKNPKTSKKAVGATAGGGGATVEAGSTGIANTMEGIAGAGGTESVASTKPMTYKEKRAASSKKALAAAAEAERIRNGDVSARDIGPDGRRRDTKRERDNSIHLDGEIKPEREKVEKEESTTSLLKRRDPIACRLQEIENSKFLGRRCPPTQLPACIPIPAAPTAVESNDHTGGENTVTPSNIAVDNTLSAVQCMQMLGQSDRRRKTHWDYLLDEVQWMAVDFRQELRWKLEASKQTAYACITAHSHCKKTTSTTLSSSSAISKNIPSCTLESCQLARSVAKSVSQSVAAYWTSLTESVHSESSNTGRIAAASLDSAVARPAGDCRELAKRTDQILALPLQFSTEPEYNATIIKEGNQTTAIDDLKSNKSKLIVSGSSTTTAMLAGTMEAVSYTLLSHQAAAIQRILQLNQLKFGANLYGRSFTGKTTTACALMQSWLGTAAPTTTAQEGVGVVLLVLHHRCLRRWMAELRQQQSGLVDHCLIWTKDTTAASLSTSTTTNTTPTPTQLLLLSTELLPTFIQSDCYHQLLNNKNHQTETESKMSVTSEMDRRDCYDEIMNSSLYSPYLCGILIDLRCFPIENEKKDYNDSIYNRPIRIEYLLTELSHTLPPHIVNRCLISEDQLLHDFPIETLHFLSPGTCIRDWTHTYPLRSPSDHAQHTTTGECDSHVEQIKRNTLSQLISNLTVTLKFPANADSIIAAQTRMEIVAAELDIVQATLYNITVSQILRHHGIFSGESTPKLARALLLLNKVCFHADLLSFKGDRRLDYVHGLRSAAQLTGQASTEAFPTDAHHTYDSNSGNNLSYNTSSTMSSSTGMMAANNNYWSSMSNLPSTATNHPTMQHHHLGGGSVGPAGSSAATVLGVSGFHSTLRGSTASGASFRGGVFAPGRAATAYCSSTNRRTVHSSSTSSSSSTNSKYYSEVGVELGCCKLQSLQRLLRRFSGLKVVVLLHNIDELELVKELLNQHKAQYFISFLEEKDQICPNLWCEAQDSVEHFNNPETSSGLLLCSKHVFLSPNLPPHQADAVIVLSDDWLRSTDVKDCFRLRLLNAGPTGPPLTVVRVVAGGTVEEKMARKGASFLQLQGSPVTQLYPALSELLTTSTSSPAVISSTSTSSALHQQQHRSMGSIEQQQIGSSSEQQLLLHKAPMLVQPPALHKSQSVNVLLNGSSADQLLSLSQSNMSAIGSNLQENTNTTRATPSEQGGRGKGKGFIVLGKQGATTFVKDHNTMQSLGLARARAGIASALSGHPSTDPLLQPFAQKWLKCLRADLKLAEQDFDCRKEAILITSESDMIIHSNSSSNNSSSNSVSLSIPHRGPVNRDSEDEGETITLQEGKKHVENSNPYTIGNSSGSSIASADDVAILLSRRVIHENLRSYALGNTSRSSSKCIFHGTHKFKLICQVIVNILSTTEEREKLALSRGFSELEYRRLTDFGLGRTEPERCFGKLIAPYRIDTVTPSVDPSKVKSSDCEGSQSWAKSFFVFRDLLVEARREGIEIDTRLVVNPLLSACRSDTISTQSYLHNRQAGKTELFIRYLQGNNRSSSGQSRSSKPRRSRPSASSSRKKDPTAAGGSTSTAAKQAANTGDSESQQNDSTMHEKETGSFEVGFLSDLEPSGDTPKKTTCKAAPSTAIAAGGPQSPGTSTGAPNPVPSLQHQQQREGYHHPLPSHTIATTGVASPLLPQQQQHQPHQQQQDSWHSTEDDIIICTQNAFSDPHFKRTEIWLNRALEQAKKRKRTATETRLRYTWLCTTGRTQQRLQDPIVIAQIEQLRTSIANRTAAAVAAAANSNSSSNSSSNIGSRMNSPANSSITSQQQQQQSQQQQSPSTSTSSYPTGNNNNLTQ